MADNNKVARVKPISQAIKAFGAERRVNIPENRLWQLIAGFGHFRGKVSKVLEASQCITPEQFDAAEQVLFDLLEQLRVMANQETDTELKAEFHRLANQIAEVYTGRRR